MNVPRFRPQPHAESKYQAQYQGVAKPRDFVENVDAEQWNAYEIF